MTKSPRSLSAGAAIVAFCDVDDSLITTARVSPCEGAEPCAVDNAGRICGFLSPKQRMLNQLLASSAQVVLTTARSSRSLSNLNLPVSGGYAIVSFGGVILTPDGKPVPAWHKHMERAAALYASLLEEGCNQIKEAARARNIDVRVRVVIDAGLPLYVSVKHNQRNLAELSIIKEVAEAFISPLAPSLDVHCNGNFLALLPRFLRKEYAVKWFMENLATPGALTIGLGDSVSDLPFMSLCDYLLMPGSSQVFTSIYPTSE